MLTGGFGSRLGGVDKAGLELAGATLLDRALAVCGDSTVVVAGSRIEGYDVSGHVGFVTEDPPHGGPAAGLAAAVASLAARIEAASLDRLALVAVWAVDQPGVTRETWLRLATAVPAGGDHGVALTHDGHRQFGVGVFPLAALERACAARPSWHGASLRSLVDPLVGAELESSTAEARDIDTLDDLEWWRRRSARLRGPAEREARHEGTVDDDAE